MSWQLLSVLLNIFFALQHVSDLHTEEVKAVEKCQLCTFVTVCVVSF